MSFFTAIDQILENHNSENPFLDLGGCGLRELPVEISQLTHVEAINLGDYSVSGIPGYRQKDTFSGVGLQNSIRWIPPHIIGRLPNLKALYLGGNSYPVQDFSFLRYLPQLEVLYVNSSKLREIDFLKYVPKLKELSLSYNTKIENYKPLLNLSKLESLFLESNEISNASDIKELPGLQILNLASNSPESLEFITELRSLEELTLDRLKNGVDLQILKDHPSLKKLSFQWAELKTVKFLNEFEKLEELNLQGAKIEGKISWAGTDNLKKLDLEFQKLESAEWISKFKDLKELNLANCLVDNFDFCLELTELESINFQGNKIAELSFFQQIPKLKAANFSHNEIKEFPELGFNFLEELNLDENNFQGIIAVKNCPNLRELKIFSKNISCLILSNLPKIKELIIKGESYSSVKEPYKLQEIIIEDNFIPLQKLTVQETLLSNLQFIKMLPNLTDVKLYKNKIQNIATFRGLKSLTTLDVSYNEIESLEEFENIPFLENLRLNNNNIYAIGSFCGLDNLKSLFLSNNNLENIGPLQGLQFLSRLSLEGNSIIDINPLVSLTGLRWLYLANNQIREINSIGNLINIQTINISNNNIRDISPIRHLKKLRSLFAANTNAGSYNEIRELRNLEDINLRSNSLEDLGFLNGHEHLGELNLSDNKLDRFPQELFYLPAISRIYLSGNPIPNIPKELLENSGNYYPHVFSWFYELRKGSKANNELKLILVGNGRVGKSCLLDRLIGLDFDPQKESTHAIRMERWFFPHQNESININAWDFGGQDIYHGTHRLFLQSRALFLLVWDHETEQEPMQEDFIDGEYLSFHNHPINYWLDYIHLLSEGSPIIVVQNKVDKSGEQNIIGKTQSKNPYNIVAFRNVSAKTGEGLHYLRNTIINSFSKMDEFGREMPITWYKAQEVIIEKTQQEKEIEHAEFKDISIKQGASYTYDSLLEFLHNTGTVYYKKDLFDNRVILDQRWAIDAVYTLLDRKGKYGELIKRMNGKFSLSDLDEVWSLYSKEEKNILLSFMKSCELCFELKYNSKNPEFLAPELLPEQDPIEASIWPGLGGQTLFFQYNHHVLHKALIQRFMIKVGNRAQHSTMWRSGTFLSYKGSYAMIKAKQNYSIDIQVKGPEENSKILLDMIRNEFHGLIDSYEEIEQLVSIDGEHFFYLNKLKKSHGKLNEILDSNDEYVEKVSNLLPFIKINSTSSIQKLIDEKRPNDYSWQKSELKKIVEEDLLKAIDQLMNFKIQGEIENELFMYRSKYNKLVNDFKEEQINYETQSQGISRIQWALLEFIDLLEV